MRVTFLKLNMEHFKGQEQFTIEFGPITRISGRNGAGKSSSGEAATWLLFNCDMLGSKLDPTPVTADKDTVTKVELLLSFATEDQEPQQLLLGKQIAKGKIQYFINEVPEKAGRFDEVVSELFDKNLFLSIFNPVYFPSQNWKDQRAQLLKYVEEPFRAEILEKMTKAGKVALEERLKQHSLEQLVKIFGPKHKDSAVKVERAGERIVTLKEQLAAARAAYNGIDLTAVKDELFDLEDKFTELKANNNKANEQNSKKSEAAYTLKNLKIRIQSLANEAKQKEAEPLQEHCETCGQELDAISLGVVKQSRQEQINKIIVEGTELADQYRALFKEWEALPDPTGLTDITKLTERIYELKNILDAEERTAALIGQVERAELAKEQIRQDYLEAQAVLDAAKEYETIKAELMVTKVGALFDKLTVKLFETFKNSESKPTFEIEYQGKPYAKLSTAERIKAGLEVAEALMSQAKITLPVFVDNAESIIIFKQPKGQLITATVKNSHLVVKQEGQE